MESVWQWCQSIQTPSVSATRATWSACSHASTKLQMFVQYMYDTKSMHTRLYICPPTCYCLPSLRKAASLLKICTACLCQMWTQLHAVPNAVHSDASSVSTIGGWLTTTSIQEPFTFCIILRPYTEFLIFHQWLHRPVQLSCSSPQSFAVFFYNGGIWGDRPLKQWFGPALFTIAYWKSVSISNLLH